MSQNTSPPRTSAPSGWTHARDVAYAYLMLTKPQIIELLLVATVPAMVVSQRGFPPLTTIILTLVAGTLGAASANGFNSLWEADSDKKMNRTRRRPMPNAKIPRRHAAVFIVLLGIVSYVIAFVWINPLTANLIVFANLFYVVVYTMYLKKRTSQNIVIGGIAGCIPVLAGWAAVRNQLDLTAWLMFAVLFLWTPPHTWALALKYRDDYAAADIPMLPVVVSIKETARQILGYTLLMVAFSLLMGLSTYASWLYFIAALLLGGWFIYQTIKLYQIAHHDMATYHDAYRIGPELGAQGMRVFGYSIAYLGLIYIALALDVVLRFRPLPIS